jgi:hypothetical protein
MNHQPLCQMGDQSLCQMGDQAPPHAQLFCARIQTVAQERGKSIKVLDRAYPEATLPLLSALPIGERVWQSLHASFAELPKLAQHLEKIGFDGALVLPEAVALVFEGKIVNACAQRGEDILWGDVGLLEFSRRYSAGTPLEGLMLERTLCHALSGLQDRPWRVNPTDGFTGARVSGGYMIFLQDGNTLGRVQIGGRENGAYPAALRPKPLTLPRVIGAWASERYVLTLRGRDAVNPITDTYNRARAAHGKPALEVLTLLGRGKTPLEVAATLEKDTGGFEAMVEIFIREGLLSRRPDPMP